MKIALIGNMNNNHFSMMRYFRDLGFDAYLFKFSNEFDHFQPKCDTFYIKKWDKFIIRTNIINGDFVQYLSLKKKYLYNVFKGFDFYIGNGMTPMYLKKAGIHLDLFVPYALGIEFTYRDNKRNFLDFIKEKIISYFQKNAIKKNVSIVCSSEEVTIKKSLYLEKHTERLSIPMVYSELKENIPKEKIKSLESIFKKLLKFDFKVMSHVSHVDHKGMIYKIKRNDIFIKSFAKYVKQNPNHKSVLILLEYGNDIKYSKKLIKDLGIDSKVVWLPIMERKHLMLLIDQIDMGASEFGGFTWGGTGWEFLSNGKVFFHYINLSNDEIKKTLGMSIPNFINTKSISEISEKLNYFYNNRKKLQVLEKQNKIWYDQNVGIELAKKYIKLLELNI